MRCRECCGLDNINDRDPVFRVGVADAAAQRRAIAEDRANAGVDDLFFAGSAIKSNFLINIGYGNPAVIRPREERYAFDEACRIV